MKMGPLSGLDQIFWFLRPPRKTNQDGLRWAGRHSGILRLTSGEEKVDLSLALGGALSSPGIFYVRGIVNVICPS